jgi:hypothetical protein
LVKFLKIKDQLCVPLFGTINPPPFREVLLLIDYTGRLYPKYSMRNWLSKTAKFLGGKSANELGYAREIDSVSLPPGRDCLLGAAPGSFSSITKTCL